VKLCGFVASLHPHMLTNFGQFILIFNKMALIFLTVLLFLPFHVSSFNNSDCLDLIANDKWSQFTRP